MDKLQSNNQESQNQLLSKQTTSLTLSSKEEEVPALMVKIITQANISRPNNFVMLNPEEWLWIVDDIRVHPKYKMLSLGDLEKTIKRGIRGEFNKTQYCVNAFTIFKWLEQAWEEYSEVKKEEIRSNFNPKSA